MRSEGETAPEKIAHLVAGTACECFIEPSVTPW